MNNYIEFRNKTHLVRDNLSSVLLYFDYFNNDITLPKYMNTQSKLIIFKIIRLIIKITFYTKIYKLKYQTRKMNEDFLVKISGLGKWSNIITLKKVKGKLKILKKTFNKNIYLKEKKFYEKYKNNSQIILPNCKFLEKNIIETDFIEAKSFQRVINEGMINFKQAMKYFETVVEKLDFLYRDTKTLVHGDLDLANIILKENYLYFIDYSESKIFNPKYDLYVLIYSILSSFNYIKSNEKTLTHFTLEGKSISKILNTDINTVKMIEKEFIKYRKKRFPKFYDN